MYVYSSIYTYMYTYMYIIYMYRHTSFFLSEDKRLQLCVGFCRTTVRNQSQLYTYPLHLEPLPSHPSRSSQRARLPLCCMAYLFTALHFTALCKYCIFYKQKAYGNLSWSKTIGTIFPVAVAHSLCSLCHFLVILTVF